MYVLDKVTFISRVAKMIDPEYFPKHKCYHFTTLFVISVLEMSESCQVIQLKSTVFLRLKYVQACIMKSKTLYYLSHCTGFYSFSSSL